MKKSAEELVEKNLQKAQSSYQTLMKHRQMVQSMACQINEASESANPKYLQSVYTGECLTQYQSMMKALSVIKQLRIEIGKFQKTASSAAPVHKDTDVAKAADHEQETLRQSCFGCIQEYL